MVKIWNAFSLYSICWWVFFSLVFFVWLSKFCISAFILVWPSVCVWVYLFVKVYFHTLNCSYCFIQLLLCVFLVFMKEFIIILMSLNIFIFAILNSLACTSDKLLISGNIRIDELLSWRSNCLDYSLFFKGIWPSGFMKFMTFLGVDLQSHCYWIGFQVFVCSDSNLSGCGSVYNLYFSVLGPPGL